MARAVIKAEYVRLIQPFISQEDFRYYLNGFAIEPHPNKGVVIVATDGHKLGAFHDESGACDSKMIGALPQSLASRRVSVRIWATKIQATALAMVASCAETPIIRLVNLLDAPIHHEGGFGIGAADWPEAETVVAPEESGGLNETTLSHINPVDQGLGFQRSSQNDRGGSRKEPPLRIK